MPAPSLSQSSRAHMGTWPASHIASCGHAVVVGTCWLLLKHGRCVYVCMPYMLSEQSAGAHAPTQRCTPRPSRLQYGKNAEFCNCFWCLLTLPRYDGRAPTVFWHCAKGIDKKSLRCAEQQAPTYLPRNAGWGIAACHCMLRACTYNLSCC